MLYGAQYYRPPFPQQPYWKRDFENMERLGFNCVKFWAVWNWIETAPGEFHFDELDALCDLAAEHSLKVIINLIPEGAPYWTWDGNGDNLYCTAAGERIYYGGPANIPSAGWPGRCMDDPRFAAMVSSFIENTARHFSPHPALFSFDVWNEPHLEPMYDYRSSLLCYCKHSRSAFVSWLQKKYGCLESLNQAWYRKYSDWSQIEPPPRFGTWADMLDWRKFWLENISRWLSLRVASCRKGAADIPVQTHVAYSGILGNKISGGLANELGDEFILARQVDFFGLSGFPKWLMGEEHYYRHLLHNEMIAQAAGEKPFFQVELQGGAGKPGLLGGEVPSAEDVRIWNYNTIAAGGKGSVYWQYSPEPAGLESPGFGLTGFKGENTPRSLSAGKCAGELNKSLLDRARRLPVTNAVYVSRKTDMLCFASERREELYVKSLSGFFRAAYAKGIPCRFFHEDQLRGLPGSGIKVLCLPMPLVISPEEAAVFSAFVNEGGTLITEACPGLYEESGLLDRNGGIIQKLFNVDHVEVQALGKDSRVKIHFAGGSLSGIWYRQLVNAGKGSVPTGFFEDGETALTEYAYGKGRALWIGTYAAASFELNPDQNTGNFLASLLDPFGYRQIRFCSVETESFPSRVFPVIRLLETDERFILVLVNHSEKETRIHLDFNFDASPLNTVLAGLECKIVEIQK
ncbi:MAG: beta-galactosidase [Treponema sp.]|nr:beta-galactosidase [Treponema sp.]